MGLCSVHKAWGFFQENFFKWNNGSKRHLFWTGRTIINHNNKTSLTVLLIKPSLILPALFFFLTSEMIFNLHIVFFWTRTTFLKSSIYAMKHRYSLFWLLLTTEIKTKTVSRGYNFSRISHKHLGNWYLSKGTLQSFPYNTIIVGSLILNSQIFP